MRTRMRPPQGVLELGSTISVVVVLLLRRTKGKKRLLALKGRGKRRTKEERSGHQSPGHLPDSWLPGFTMKGMAELTFWIHLNQESAVSSYVNLSRLPRTPKLSSW